MRTMDLREFVDMDLKGYEFIFSIDNQTEDYKNRRWSVAYDRRVFTKMNIARNPNCVMLSNSHEERLCLDGVVEVNVRGSVQDDFFFDIVCSVGSLKDQTYTFLARKPMSFSF